ncbi:MAG: H-X9-DG-CTERM domain-containing protein, partial [Armatimonadota bacterium]
AFHGIGSLAEINNPVGDSLVVDSGLCSSTVRDDQIPPEQWPEYETDPAHWQWTPPTNMAGTTTYYDNSGAGDFLRRPIARHNGGLNVSYFDGHAKWVSISAFLGPMPQGHPVGHPMNSWDNK